jgi:hypothetical protein
VSWGGLAFLVMGFFAVDFVAGIIDLAGVWLVTTMGCVGGEGWYLRWETWVRVGTEVGYENVMRMQG